MRLVVMGVAGCGKSSLGAALARALALPFTDADDLHPAANRAKMAAGHPLTDNDRWPWLQAVGAVLAAEAGVVACSALRRSYRDRLREVAGPVQFLHLVAPREVIAQRLAARRGHFMPAALLDSQLATLEPLTPGEGWTLEVSGPQDANLATAMQLLEKMPSNLRVNGVKGRILPCVRRAWHETLIQAAVAPKRGPMPISNANRPDAALRVARLFRRAAQVGSGRGGNQGRTRTRAKRFRRAMSVNNWALRPRRPNGNRRG